MARPVAGATTEHTGGEGYGKNSCRGDHSILEVGGEGYGKTSSRGYHRAYGRGGGLWQDQ